MKRGTYIAYYLGHIEVRKRQFPIPLLLKNRNQIQEEPVCMLDEMSWSFKNQMHLAATPEFDPSSIKEGSMSGRILVVDHDPSIRIGLVEFLSAYHFEVTPAETPMEALDILSRGTYNVAIVDLLLPGMDGDTMISKANEIQPALNYIIYTGVLNPKLSEPLIRARIKPDQIFIKPVESAYQFVEMIKKLLS